MRVTQSMLSNNFLKHLSNNYDKMGKIQEQMNTQKKITRPSDDPVVAMKGVAYRTNLTEVQQFKRNFTEAHNWLDNTDAALDQAKKALERIRQLTVQASNGTLEENQRASIAEEVKQLKSQIADIANTQVGDKYIFNGTDTLNPPTSVDANGNIVVKTPSNNNPVKLELANGVYIQVNSVNSDTNGIFNQELFDSMDKLITNLEADDQDALKQDLNNLDTHINNLVNERATVGARSNRIELMEDRIDQQEISVTKMMSKNEDADMEKVITDLITQEAVQRASLGVGARIIQPTLLDFLR
ncbi:flagellar hook-associated protein FlgL [Heyndrickxia oleronia]|uniref:Flagellar hook-associated protein FlgL n=1 Tax=Heyndrickxia oleronia TaxID=38875 RepID=A0AAW6SSW8_9BACI|nr:flagellar hook-associated protein FlgL [Heyndrickxia oleronia]MDH5161278.1 flagellar hook-associated protein FlgL [Heyndrickxia oleronia]